MSGLVEAVKQAAEREMRHSSQYSTRETINLRVLKLVLSILETELTTVYKTRDQIEVDTSVSKVIENLWKKRQIYITSVSKQSKIDFESVMEKFLSRDFISPSDLIKFCQTIQKVECTEEARRKLWILFAFDGLKGSEYKNYMKFLSIRLDFGEKPDSICRDDLMSSTYEEEGPGVTHVRAIRSIYRFLSDITPNNLSQVLKSIHGMNEENTDGECDDESDNESDDGVQNKCIEKYYRKLVGRRLSSISSWLKTEKEEVMKQEMLKEKRRRLITSAITAKKAKRLPDNI